jgi:hypothetical protein
MEPLDKQADERDDPIHPENNTDENPVDNTDEQFKAACVMLEGKELVWSLCFGHFYISLMVDPVWQKILSPNRSDPVNEGQGTH